MLAKNRNLSIKTIALILMVLILAFFTLGAKALKLERIDLVQYLMSMNLGFSNRINLVDGGEGFFFWNTPEGQIQYKKMASLMGCNVKRVAYIASKIRKKRAEIEKILDIELS